MKKLVRLSLAFGEALWIHLSLATPAAAQLAVSGGAGTSSPSSASTTSALPEAGTGSLTLFLVIVGIFLAVVGVILALRTAKQEV